MCENDTFKTSQICIKHEKTCSNLISQIKSGLLLNSLLSQPSQPSFSQLPRSANFIVGINVNLQTKFLPRLLGTMNDIKYDLPVFFR